MLFTQIEIIAIIRVCTFQISTKSESLNVREQLTKLRNPWSFFLLSHMAYLSHSLNLGGRELFLFKIIIKLSPIALIFLME